MQKQIVHSIDSVSDIKGKMKARAEALAVEDVSKSAISLSQSVMEEFENKFVGMAVKMLTITQLKKVIYAARGSEFKDWENAIQCYPLGTCSTEDERSFLQFYLTVLIHGELEKVIGWGHPDLLFR